MRPGSSALRSRSTHRDLPGTTPPPSPSPPAVHLVDFFVVARNRDRNQVHDWELGLPKDVVQLDPSMEVALYVRCVEERQGEGGREGRTGHIQKRGGGQEVQWPGLLATSEEAGDLAHVVHAACMHHHLWVLVGACWLVDGRPRKGVSLCPAWSCACFRRFGPHRGE